MLIGRVGFSNQEFHRNSVCENGLKKTHFQPDCEGSIKAKMNSGKHFQRAILKQSVAVVLVVETLSGAAASATEFDKNECASSVKPIVMDASETEIFLRVKKTLEMQGVQAKKITPNARLGADLNIDDVGIENLNNSFGEKYGWPLEQDETVASMNMCALTLRVGDYVKVIAGYLAASHPPR
jgi:hypothetical protein